MGAGRIVYQELTRITKEIQDGTFFTNPELMDAVENCKKNDSAFHMFGLVSDGGVHSHNTNILKEIILTAEASGNLSCPVGTEVEEHYAVSVLDGCNGSAVFHNNRVVSGRYYAMDRDNNYDRVQLAYDALTKGEGLQADSATGAIQESYDRGETDEFVKPTVVMKNGAA
mgnify:CR=1 FL=1